MTAKPFANQTLDHCQSTNDLAKELAQAGYPEGTWVSARTQQMGRGRLGRKWESMTGNLFLSILARIEDPTLWSWIPLTAAIGIVSALSQKYDPYFMEFRIKWPNDIWAVDIGGYAKLGGILCEASSFQGQSHIVVGVGVNCTQSPILGDREQPATDLTRLLSGVPVCADDIRSALVDQLRKAFQQLRLNGKEWAISEYSQYCLFKPGTQISWGPGGLANSGRVVGLGPSAELRVQRDGGDELGLYSEDVRTLRVRTKGDEFLL